MIAMAEIKVASPGEQTSSPQDRENVVLLRAFAPLHCVAMGVASGVVTSALLVIVATALLLRGTDEAITAGSLLGQFFWGYSVSWSGIFVALLWGFFVGFVLGYGLARIRNTAIWLWLTVIRSRAEMEQYSDLLDHF